MESYTEVFVWGNNSYGQLGQEKEIYSTPTQSHFKTRIKQIACGDSHTSILTPSGEVLAMGSNFEGRLGVPDLSFSSSPIVLQSLVHIEQISCGWGHSIAISQTGRAYGWGSNEFGALGTGVTTPHVKPTEIPISQVISVSCGAKHSLFLTEDAYSSYVFACGTGDVGQLGTGKREKELTPVQLPLERIRQIACGLFHSAFVNDKGLVYTTGANSFGQLGQGHKIGSCKPILIEHLDKTEKVALGNHSAAISSSGELFIWGTGPWGEFLLPKKIEVINKVEQIAIGGSFGVCVDVKGCVYTWGTNCNGELGTGSFVPQELPLPVQSLYGKTVTKVACGGNFCFAISEDVYRMEKEREVVEESYSNRLRDMLDDCSKKNNELLCDMNFMNSHKENLERTLAEAEDRLAGTNQYVSELEANNECLNQQVFKLQDIIQQNEIKMNEYSRTVKRLEENINEIQMNYDYFTKHSLMNESPLNLTSSFQQPEKTFASSTRMKLSTGHLRNYSADSQLNPHEFVPIKSDIENRIQSLLRKHSQNQQMISSQQDI